MMAASRATSKSLRDGAILAPLTNGTPAGDVRSPAGMSSAFITGVAGVDAGAAADDNDAGCALSPRRMLRAGRRDDAVLAADAALDGPPLLEDAWAPHAVAGLVSARRTSVSTVTAILVSRAGFIVAGMVEHSQSATWAADSVPNMREYPRTCDCIASAMTRAASSGSASATGH